MHRLRTRSPFGLAAHRLLDPPHALAVPPALAVALLLLTGSSELATRGEEEEDGLDGLRDEREELFVEGEEVLEAEGRVWEAKRARPLRGWGLATGGGYSQ